MRSGPARLHGVTNKSTLSPPAFPGTVTGPLIIPSSLGENDGGSQLNRNHRRKPLLGVLGILALLMSIPGEVGAGRDVCDFSGTWQINKDLSEDPRAKMQQRTQSRRGGGMGSGGGGRGPGMGDPQAARDRMRRMEEGSRTLTILHVEPELTIRTADDRERLLYTDGRKQQRTGGIGPVETRAKWKKTRLIETGRIPRVRRNRITTTE